MRGPVGGGPSGARPGPGAGQALPPGLAGSVNLTIPLTTWLGLTARPGDAAGHGPLDAGTSRGLAALLAARPASRWCLTILGDSGRAIGHGCARAGPGPPGQRSNPRGWLAGMAADRGLRPPPRNPRLPAITGPAAPGQDPAPDLHVPRLPAGRPAVR